MPSHFCWDIMGWSLLFPSLTACRPHKEVISMWPFIWDFSTLECVPCNFNKVFVCYVLIKDTVLSTKWLRKGTGINTATMYFTEFGLLRKTSNVIFASKVLLKHRCADISGKLNCGNTLHFLGKSNRDHVQCLLLQTQRSACKPKNLVVGFFFPTDHLLS